MNNNFTNLPKVRGKYRFNVNLSKSNWFNVGGRADILFKPKDINDLKFFLENKDSDLPIEIIGVGSNVIIKDGGIRGVLIKLGSEFAKISHENDILTLGAGCLCGNVALHSKIYGLSNLEFLVGIPGSIGGAIFMNAGCYGSEISNYLISLTAINQKGEIIEFKNSDINFSYRNSNLDKDLLILEGKFRLKKSSTEAVAYKISQFIKNREESQPIRVKTGGSTFKNPKNMKAWELIDKAGCRGMKLGGATMSEKHCNFMVNDGTATASDLINLGNKVIDQVKEKTGIKLEWEIKIIGENQKEDY